MFKYSPVFARATMAVLLLVSSGSHGQSLPDPTRHPDAPVIATEATADVGWTLQATRISGNHRNAIINGQNVRIGERIGGARVLSIEHGHVQLDIAGQRRTLTMFAAPGTSPLIRKSAPPRAGSMQGSHP